MKNYLIVGNGIAAAGCVEGIRSVDPDGAITVVSEEKHHVYSRPPHLLLPGGEDGP